MFSNFHIFYFLNHQNDKKHFPSRCDSYVFRCAYGACIDLDLRCNGAVNCADGSDEDPSLCVKGTTERPKVTTRPTANRPNTPRPTSRPTPRPTQRPTQRPTDEIHCSVPSQPQNGHYKLYKSHCPNRENCDVSPGIRSFEKGTQLIYSCNSGFRMEGYKDVLCGPDGKWLHIPECIGVYYFIVKNNSETHLFVAEKLI